MHIIEIAVDNRSRPAILRDCGINPIKARLRLFNKQLSAVGRHFFMLTRQQKEQVVSELADKLSRASSVVFTDFTGLKVEDMETLRGDLREAGIEYKVAKKRLIKKALKKAGLKLDASGFEGQIALAFGYADPLVPAQALYKFSRTNEAFKLLGGVIEKEGLSQEAILELAMLPPKEVLFARLVGSIKAPLAGLANVLGGNLRGLVYTLKAISSK